MRRPPLDLQPRWSKIFGPPAEASPGAVRPEAPPPQEQPRDQAQGIKRRLDQLLAQDGAQRNVTTGRVHPTLYDIQRDARKLMHPTWAMTEGDRSGIGSVLNSNRSFWRSWMKGYLKNLERRASRHNDQPRDEEGLSMLDVYETMKRTGQENAQAFRCQLCVTIGLETSPKIQIRRSSSRKPFDKLAVNALRTALRLRPPPADLQPVRVCYRLSAIFDRMPILPMAGCNFDESELSLSCYYPTMKVQDTKVELLSVEPVVLPRS